MAVTVLRDRVVAHLVDAHLVDAITLSADAWCSPLLCTASTAAIKIIVEQELPARADVLGMHLKQGLRRVAEAFPSLVVDVPGRGLMIGAKLKNNILEYALWLQLFKRGILSGLSTNTHTAQPVLRLFPPLTVTRPEINRVIEAFHDALCELDRMPSLLYRFGNEALKFQHHLPRSFLRWGTRLIS